MSKKDAEAVFARKNADNKVLMILEINPESLLHTDVKIENTKPKFEIRAKLKNLLRSQK